MLQNITIMNLPHTGEGFFMSAHPTLSIHKTSEVEICPRN